MSQHRSQTVGKGASPSQSTIYPRHWTITCNGKEYEHSLYQPNLAGSNGTRTQSWLSDLKEFRDSPASENADANTITALLNTRHGYYGYREDG
jgi:hypothetical protein